MLGISLALAVASFIGQMQYRSQFVTMVFMGIFYQGTGFAMIWVIVDRFHALAGWTLEEVAFLYALRLLAHAVYGVFFNGTARVYDLTRSGEFDRYLVRPVPPLLQVMFERVHVASIGDFLGGLALFIAVAGIVAVDWTAGAMLYAALAVVGGALVEAGVRLAGAALSFRLTNLNNLNWLLDSLFSNFGSYPLGIFAAGVRVLLTWALPIAFVAYFPASVLLGRTGELSVHPAVAYAAPAFGGALLGAAILFWGAMMRQYQSAGH